MSEECGLGSVAWIDLDLMEAYQQVEGGEEPRAKECGQTWSICGKGKESFSVCALMSR